MANPTSTVGAGARITARRKTKDSVILKPGIKHYSGSSINIQNPEGTIAAYCGFNDIGKFRKFYLGPLVMPYFLKSLSYTGYRRRHVLSLVAECPADRYWAEDKDPEEVYPVNEYNHNYRMALNLCQMLRRLRQGLSDDTPAVDPAEFERLTGCKFPSGAALDPEDVPGFGPFAGESDLEPLNRCLCLFAHIKYTKAKSQWEKRFFGKSAWDASVSISVEYQPDWMRQTPPVAIAEAPAPFSILVKWKHASKNKKNVAFVKEKMEEGVFDEMPKHVTVAITRDVGPSEFRDYIRQAFELDKYEGNLEMLKLEAGDEEISALQPDWSIWRKAMLETTGTPTFWCLFRPLDDGEVPWEYGGPPTPLQNFVEDKEEDVAPKQKHTPDHVEQVQ